MAVENAGGGVEGSKKNRRNPHPENPRVRHPVNALSNITDYRLTGLFARQIPDKQ